MAPKAKPDSALVAWAKELRQATALEEKMKQIEKMRKEAPQHHLPSHTPKGRPKRKAKKAR